MTKIPPEDVLDLAKRVEDRELPDMHPLIGSPDVELLDEDPGLPLRAMRPPPPPRSRTYCDSCGYVDDHAHDCPHRVAQEAAREEAREVALERAAQHQLDEPIRVQLRRLAGSVLRRVARALDGK